MTHFSIYFTAFALIIQISSSALYNKNINISLQEYENNALYMPSSQYGPVPARLIQSPYTGLVTKLMAYQGMSISRGGILCIILQSNFRSCNDNMMIREYSSSKFLNSYPARSNQSGVILQILVYEGDFVVSGQPIAVVQVV